MKNLVLLLAFNNADLTMAAIDSVLAQTIPVQLFVIDNGSTDGTWERLMGYADPNLTCIRNLTNIAPTKAANKWLRRLFEDNHHVLCMGNDIVLPPNFYEEILKWPRGIVAASEIKDREVYDEHIKNIPPILAVSENTPMAILLLRKWCYDAVIAKDGYFFDEGMFHYASDCDLALRIASCGIRGIQLSAPYWHYSSASWKTRPAEEQAEANAQANADRQYFICKWGFGVSGLEYGQLAVDINFKG